MILITDQGQPAVCSRCGEEIATLITASTLRNRRPHIVRVATGYYRIPNGDIICPACWPDHLAEQRLVLDVAVRKYQDPAEPAPVFWRPQPERRNGGKPQPVPEILALNRMRQNGHSGQNGHDGGEGTP